MLDAAWMSVGLRVAYFAELREGDRECNDPTSTRFHNYIRGREPIAALFPESEADTRSGDIQMFAPCGQIVVGVEGQVPPATAGIMTLGSGGVQMYSKGSTFMGPSRIMTTRRQSARWRTASAAIFAVSARRSEDHLRRPHAACVPR
jgi:hypothetical protein